MMNTGSHRKRKSKKGHIEKEERETIHQPRRENKRAYTHLHVISPLPGTSGSQATFLPLQKKHANTCLPFPFPFPFWLCDLRLRPVLLPDWDPETEPDPSKACGFPDLNTASSSFGLMLGWYTGR